MRQKWKGCGKKIRRRKSAKNREIGIKAEYRRRSAKNREIRI